MLITDQVATASCTDRVQLCCGLLRQSHQTQTDPVLGPFALGHISLPQ